jgi:hypothetical protein
LSSFRPTDRRAPRGFYLAIARSVGRLPSLHPPFVMGAISCERLR